ncbi:MAG: DinB family protein [Chloroflexi bacterium]|nr:DinB family protein [Chloroflexota bacterium]
MTEAISEDDMEWQELVIDGYDRALHEVEAALEGLTRKDLDQQPDPNCNTIGWTVWHLVRGQDSQIAALAGKEQLWIADRWHEKFGRPANAADTGYGDTPEAVRAFRSPDAGTHLAYFRATIDQSKRYISILKSHDLDRNVHEPWFPPRPTLGGQVVSVMADALVHAGEIDYLRGLLTAMGKLEARDKQTIP